MILAGQKDAKKRVFIFFTVYIISGVMSKSHQTIIIVLLNIIFHSFCIWALHDCYTGADV